MKQKTKRLFVYLLLLLFLLLFTAVTSFSSHWHLFATVDDKIEVSGKLRGDDKDRMANGLIVPAQYFQIARCGGGS